MFDYEICKTRDKGRAILTMLPNTPHASPREVSVLGGPYGEAEAYEVRQRGTGTAFWTAGHLDNLPTPPAPSVPEVKPEEPEVVWVGVAKEEFTEGIRATSYANKNRESARLVSKAEESELHPIFLNCLHPSELSKHGIFIAWCLSGFVVEHKDIEHRLSALDFQQLLTVNGDFSRGEAVYFRTFNLALDAASKAAKNLSAHTAATGGER